MAVVKLDDLEVEVADGSDAQIAAEQLGVPFACCEGVCRVCEVEVIDGMNNLNPVTEEELNVGLEDNSRLMCRCKINSGTVTILLDTYSPY